MVNRARNVHNIRFMVGTAGLYLPFIILRFPDTTLCFVATHMPDALCHLRNIHRPPQIVFFILIAVAALDLRSIDGGARARDPNSMKLAALIVRFGAQPLVFIRHVRFEIIVTTMLLHVFDHAPHIRGVGRILI